MKIRLAICFVLTVGFLMVYRPAFAHHGNVAYDMTKRVVLKNAAVTKFFSANPHSILTFDVKDDKGNVVHWTGETGSPAAVGPLGWFRDVVKPGDIITVYMWQSKAGAPVGIVNKFVTADGKEYADALGGTKEDRDEAERKRDAK
jgi:hypothetical protein